MTSKTENLLFIAVTSLLILSLFFNNNPSQAGLAIQTLPTENEQPPILIKPTSTPPPCSDNDRDGDLATYCGGKDCNDLNPSLNGNDNDRDGVSTCLGDCDDYNPRITFCT
ncbi:hypothetical protein D6783_01585 [Candidatus Woesearchaeota archaeon]|nr:MAG: hypothetical protein D6783_01585 [Candidatus Woesearchaeota archaeon]